MDPELFIIGDFLLVSPRWPEALYTTLSRKGQTTGGRAKRAGYHAHQVI
jgi:hypothetical protein